MGSKYRAVEDGEIVTIENGAMIITACCDCGLVHLEKVESVDGGEVEITAWRDNRRTGQVRRYRNIKMERI